MASQEKQILLSEIDQTTLIAANIGMFMKLIATLDRRLKEAGLVLEDNKFSQTYVEWVEKQLDDFLLTKIKINSPPK